MPAARADAPARVARHRLLHAADLLRFLRLLRHGDRPRAHVRLPVPRELPVPLHRRHRAGVLAALAHVALDLVPRLPLRAARRQPRRTGADLPQSGHGVLPVRPLARRELELRHLGPVPRRRSWCSSGSGSRRAAQAAAAVRPSRLPAASSSWSGWVFFRAETLPGGARLPARDVRLRRRRAADAVRPRVVPHA